jgi:hypothetical protein
MKIARNERRCNLIAGLQNGFVVCKARQCAFVTASSVGGKSSISLGPECVQAHGPSKQFCGVVGESRDILAARTPQIIETRFHPEALDHSRTASLTTYAKSLIFKRKIRRFLR